MTAAEVHYAFQFFPTPAGSLGNIMLCRIIQMWMGRHAPSATGRGLIVDNQDRVADNQDRISYLPGPLRSNILARLPLRDALQTRAISKRWRGLWASTPLFLDDSCLSGSRHDQRIRAITRVLHLHPGPFHSISLTGICFDLMKPALVLWLRILASKCVRDLILVNQPMPFDLELPTDILTCRNLRRLWVAFFRFPTAGAYSMEFPCLEQFGLLHTSIASSDLEHVIRGSPVLEILAFVWSLGKPSHIHLYSHSPLRALILWLSVAEEVSIDAAMRLERFVMWKTDGSNPGAALKVHITNAPKLRVLGYLEPALHQLQIGDTIIKAGTVASPNIIIPSVQVLALRVCFKDCSKLKLVPAFLGCFPNIRTLHVQSTKTDDPKGKFNMKFWVDSDIQCVSKSLREIFFHDFQGSRSELVFLKFIAEGAPELEQMVISPSSDCLDHTAELEKCLNELAYANWGSSTALLLVNRFGGDFCFSTASDLSIDDPFFSMKDLCLPKE